MFPKAPRCNYVQAIRCGFKSFVWIQIDYYLSLSWLGLILFLGSCNDPACYPLPLHSLAHKTFFTYSFKVTWILQRSTWVCWSLISKIHLIEPADSPSPGIYLVLEVFFNHLVLLRYEGLRVQFLVDNTSIKKWATKSLPKNLMQE